MFLCERMKLASFSQKRNHILEELEKKYPQKPDYEIMRMLNDIMKWLGDDSDNQIYHSLIEMFEEKHFHPQIRTFAIEAQLFTICKPNRTKMLISLSSTQSGMFTVLYYDVHYVINRRRFKNLDAINKVMLTQ